MSEIFNLEIISPDKKIIKAEVKQVSIPAFEGEMTILKDHISLITFLRPGIIEVELHNGIEKFYIEEGTVEFYKNNLLILSSTVKNKKDLNDEEISRIIENSKIDINKNKIKDKEKYILSYKIDTLQNLRN
jgi:F-type H+-transporting ATPase subunit epsilon